MADIKVAVLVPNHSQWAAGFGWSLANMLITFCEAKYEGGKKEVEVINVGGSILPEVRHRLVAEAMKIDATHALCLDSDMMFPRDTLQMLLRHNMPIVGANYVRRKLPTIPTAHLGNDKGGILWTEEGDTGLVEVKHMGFGCVLIDMRVFDQIELPFFKFEETENRLGFKGEDVYFFEKCAQAGIPAFVDQELSQHITHIGEFQFTHGMALEGRRVAKDRDLEKAAAE